MKNIVDYVMDQGHLTFAEKPFNEVDSLLLSQLSYINFKGLVPGIDRLVRSTILKNMPLLEVPDEMYLGTVGGLKNKDLIQKMQGTKRYSSMGLNYYVDDIDLEKEMQFSALTFIIDEKNSHIVFRGTDKSLVGWKEDFNMAFQCPVPAQVAAVEYVKTVAGRTEGNLYLSGHSKGGNLAVYATIFSEEPVQNRIKTAYSHDGPGFRNEVFQNPKYEAVTNLIRKTLPQTAVVGMLLMHQEKYKVVYSSKYGLLQHDPYSWIVDKGDFKFLKDIDEESKYTNEAISNWLDSMDDAQRKVFVDTLYDLIHQTNALTLDDFTENTYNKIKTLVDSSEAVDEKTKVMITEIIRGLMGNLFTAFRERIGFKNRLTHH